MAAIHTGRETYPPLLKITDGFNLFNIFLDLKMASTSTNGIFKFVKILPLTSLTAGMVKKSLARAG